MRTLFALLMATALIALVAAPALAVEGEPDAEEQAQNADSVKELLNVCGTVSLPNVAAVKNAELCLNAGRLTLDAGPSWQYELQKEVGNLEEDGFTLRSQLEGTAGVTTSVAVDDFSAETVNFGAFAELQGQAIARVQDVGTVNASLFARLEFNNNGFKNNVGLKLSKDFAL